MSPEDRDTDHYGPFHMRNFVKDLMTQIKQSNLYSKYKIYSFITHSKNSDVIYKTPRLPRCRFSVFPSDDAISFKLFAITFVTQFLCHGSHHFELIALQATLYGLWFCLISLRHSELTQTRCCRQILYRKLLSFYLHNIGTLLPFHSFCR